jgi:hypothetical protein
MKRLKYFALLVLAGAGGSIVATWFINTRATLFGIPIQMPVILVVILGMMWTIAGRMDKDI